MAGKKIPSMEDALNIFKDVMIRSSLQNYVYVNNILLSKNQKNHSILIIPESGLWGRILDDEELKKNIKEIDILSDNNNDRELFQYGEETNSIWFEIDPVTIYNGAVLKVRIDGFEYDVPIHKNLLPLKLRKAEFNNISYQVNRSPDVLLLKKKFEYPIEGASFSIMRILQIL